MDGTLVAGEALPSMRALAKELHLSVITVQRAYEDLQRAAEIGRSSGISLDQLTGILALFYKEGD